MRLPPALRSCAIPFAIALAATPAALFASAEPWQSELVRVAPDGALEYPADTEGNRIPDFSHAGYRGGGVPLPEVPVVRTLAPVSGDNTARLQAALDAIGALPLDLRTRLRGALHLSPGIYEISDTLFIRHSGVALLGSGRGDDPARDTILRRTGTRTTPVIQAGGRGLNDRFATAVPGTRTAITTPRVTVGSRTFEVADATPFSPGDTVVVEHPETEKWIQALDGGGTASDPAWRVDDKDNPAGMSIRYLRRIVRIDDNRITIDAPVFNHLDRSLSQSTLYRYDPAPLLTDIGVSSLRIDIQTAGPEAETHAWDGIVFRQATDCWVRDVTVLHFVAAGIKFGERFVRGTALDCNALEPHGLIKGKRRYNFATHRGAQLVLFERCHATDARHAFISNGSTLDSGIVVLDCTNDRSYGPSEAHRRWSQGLLFDNLTTTNPRPQSAQTGILGLYCRGDWGDAHGWAAAHSVAWRCDTAGARIIIQKPPTAQNYAIGCSGKMQGKVFFQHPPGHIEGTGRPGLVPRSLYRAQLAQRLKTETQPPSQP
ncbi:hypothetical protein OpiT1DRAFT_00767 [Opitutaceae bacterium TAV1]|nr:hypothetical protein OpiT1DRAFT_00767 [Opitutaceae bacterium TAV1]